MEKKEFTVLIVGTYCGLNKGDRLMQEVTANLIAEAGGDPVLSSPFPNIDKQIYDGFLVEKSHRRNLPVSLIKCVVLLFTPPKLREKVAVHSSELKLFLNAKYIVDTSGDMLTEDYGIHVALSHLVPLIYCVLLNKPFIVLAQSIGPFKQLALMFKYVLNKANVVSTRDDVTFNYLNKYKFQNLKNVADLGFLLKSKKTNIDYLQNLTTNTENKIIGICPSALFFNKFKKSNIDLDMFCRMLDELAEENNLAYVLIPHVSTPTGKLDDCKFSKLIDEKLNAQSIVIDSSLSPASMKYLISHLYALASFRMHGAIAGIDSYIPTLLVSYSHKADGLFAKIGMLEYIVHNDKKFIVSFKSRLKQLIINAPDICAHLKRKLPSVRKQAAINKDIILSMSN